MPLAGYQSICKKHAPVIVSRDKRRSRIYHKADNKHSSYVTHYHIDGNVITQGNKCDFLLINEDRKMAYLIELKGEDIVQAAKQLEATWIRLKEELKEYEIQYRIIASKCTTHNIRSSKFRRFQARWKGHLKLSSGVMEEDI